MSDLMTIVADPFVEVDGRAPAALEERRARSVRRTAVFFLRRPGLVLSILFVGLVVLASFFPTWFTSRDPLAKNPREKLQGPGWHHLFGTDLIGRDQFARMVHGAALSLKATVIAVTVSLVLGALVGLVAGVAGRWVDEAVMRAVDVVLSIPTLLLSLTIVTVLGFGTVKVAVAVGLASVARFARIMRSEVLRVKGQPYVEAARSSGVRWPAVLARHVLPNALGPVLVLATVDFGIAILAVSSLSFLGYGAVPPTPEWGSLVSGGRDYLDSAWWLTTLPGLTIAATVLATNRVARCFDGEWSAR